MTAPARIAAFAAVLVAVFAIGMWVGHSLGPTPGPDSEVVVPAPTGRHGHPAGGDRP
ncbi:hypothetical protein JDV09_16110 [Mycobacterium sp. Y57]|uniref:hypothetical protein n=1 Tax=Mycolicibacterium xanthum TaxID=2796469 RepID=UPI001C865234|nr:hypothetical protein [Mycolicibacterium xanthum]MBX7433622.1 hypothetical protein [Mycolicibacterium xanthum]